MFTGREQLQVLQAVIQSVTVPVMDVVALGDRPVGGLPDQPVRVVPTTAARELMVAPGVDRSCAGWFADSLGGIPVLPPPLPMGRTVPLPVVGAAAATHGAPGVIALEILGPLAVQWIAGFAPSLVMLATPALGNGGAVAPVDAASGSVMGGHVSGIGNQASGRAGTLPSLVVATAPPSCQGRLRAVRDRAVAFHHVNLAPGYCFVNPERSH
jgi:hypothetical protein